MKTRRRGEQEKSTAATYFPVPAQSVTYGYDNLDRLTSAVMPSTSQSFGPMHRPVGITEIRGVDPHRRSRQYLRHLLIKTHVGLLDLQTPRNAGSPINPRHSRLDPHEI